MTPAAKLSLAADFFMMQALLRSAGIKSGWPYEPVLPLQYVFPRNCFRYVIHELLIHGWQPEIGMQAFSGFTVRHSHDESWVTFPSTAEEDRMHQFFEWFNLTKRRPAQGVDSSFPPLPDFFQGKGELLEHVVMRYQVQIVYAFGGADTVHIPVGPSHAEYRFRL